MPDKIESKPKTLIAILNQNWQVNKCMINMDINEELKETDIKNRTGYYLDGKIKNKGFNLNHILIDKKSNENILVYNISYKRFNAKPLCITFDKIDGFIRVFDGNRYLVLFGCEKRDSIFNRIRYFISVKSGITSIISHNYAKIKVDSYNSLAWEKTMIFHDVIILIKSVLNKDKNNYYYNIFLEKASYELPKIYVFV